jgi:hypothetical protein
MEAVELYKGIVLFVDEKLGTEKEDADDVGKIVTKLNERGIPCLKYQVLPEESLEHFHNLNFIILDWLLKPIGWQEGTEIPDTMKEDIYKANVEFIKKLKNHCFAPIFIFTNEDVGDVKETLIEGGVYNKIGENYILVKNKKDLIEGDNLFKEIESWILSNPSVYVKKVWEQNLYRAKTDAFWHLFDRSPAWPKVLWESFEDDLVDPVSSFNETIFRLVISRTSLQDLDKKIVCPDNPHTVDKEEIKAVVKGLMYLDNSSLPPNEVRPGDILKPIRAYPYKGWKGV